MAEHDNDDLVTLIDVEDNETTFRFLALIETDEGGFAMLTPSEDTGGEEMDIYLFHYDYDEEEEIENYSPIEDEELFKRVVVAAEQMVGDAAEE